MKWQEQKLDIYKFNIDVTNDHINQGREVFPVTLYLAGYCCCSGF